MRSNSRKATSKSAVAAHAKMLHAANLGWLEGLPLAVASGSVRWLAVPASAPAQELSIDGSHLSRATYALNKLRGELAPALPRLVEKPDAWLAAVERRLELLKSAVHRGEPLPHLWEEPFFPRTQRETASWLMAAEPRSQLLLKALSWLHAGHPARARTGLDLIRSWSPGLDLLAARLGELPGLVLALRLLQLAAVHGASRVQALADCLFDPRTYEVALDRGWAFCEQVRGGIAKQPKSPLPEALPSGDLGRELARWCEDLVQQNRRCQRHALRLFALATPLPLVERWALWWQAARRLLQEARELRDLPYERESRDRLRHRLESHQRSAPPALAIDELLAGLRQLLADPPLARAGHLERALALLPAEATAPGRLQLFTYWMSLGSVYGAPRVAALLAGFERYVRSKPVPDGALLQPWKEVAATRHPDTVEIELLDRARPRRMIAAAYDHLATVAARCGGLEPDAAVKAVEMLFLAGDAELAARLFDSLRAHNQIGSYHSLSVSELALRLCRSRPERFAGVLQALSAQEDRADLPVSAWPELVIGPLSEGEIGEFVRDSIVSRQWVRLQTCGTKSVLIETAGIQPLPLPAVGEAAAPDWVRRYPPPLHPALCRLAAILDDAETRVARWLADDFPDVQRLQREIAAIELRLQRPGDWQSALRARLENLRARLARPSSPGPARVERLRAKLERSWGRAVLDRWERELDALLPDALRRLLGIEEAPPWLGEARPLSLLVAASRLRGPHRLLAYRLFRARCGPPPWDLRDAPQNRQFVAGLPQLDWGPWIDGVGTVVVTAGNGRRLHLALEDDPLEIFRMGGHFQTCLSPGATNFFSVFANAADINKRVLYARDDAGRIVGRCLLALTAEGELLTFEPYCHDGGAGFARLCADFADQLARDMRTSRALCGRVPALVAANWYDDGPRDLGRRHEWLEEGSALRRRLASVHPGELVEALRRELKPARLNEATLPLILDLSELRQRPELVVPLLRLVAECPALPESSIMRAAELGIRAGSADLVRRLFLQRFADDLRRQYVAETWFNVRLAELLLALDPARLLAVLRQTRPRWVRDWSHEVDGNRLESVAAGLEALHRPQQARLLWQRLATSNHVHASAEQRQRAREALEARPREPRRGDRN